MDDNQQQQQSNEETQQPVDMSKTNLNLFNMKGEPRQRLPKKYRHKCSEEEWITYQREQNRLRAAKSRAKLKLNKAN
jgi:hypothetical protein